jgi:hypothetical protein
MMKHRRSASGLLCLAAALAAHGWLEASMLRHMLLQLPLLGVAGWLLAARWPVVRRAAVFDEHGVTILTALLFVSAYWMVPRALELSLNDGPVDAAKFASLLAIGALLPGALTRANTVIQLFFLGNFCAMTAIAGMLYQDLPQRLCNAYLLDDQVTTGVALVASSVAVALVWSVLQWRTFAPQTTGSKPCTTN